MAQIITEQRNKNTKDIDLISTLEIVKKINQEDEIVTQSIKAESKNIADAIDIISEHFLKGGKLFYFGAGTSGRLGVLDASECPPTFGVDSSMVQGIIAGGDKALRFAIEGAEDDFELGYKDAQILNDNDVCVLISASGNPKYLLGVATFARKKDIPIIALTCNSEAKILAEATVKICVQVGPEVVAGSSRMKAGSAQKMVLNMLSTGSMIKIGKTYENFMIDVKATNEKLRNRAVQIVMDLTGANFDYAFNMLQKLNWNVKIAVLVLKMNISNLEAQRLLDKNNGVLRKALLEARKNV